MELQTIPAADGEEGVSSEQGETTLPEQTGLGGTLNIVFHSVCVNLSGLYAMMLVVLGAVLPLSEAFTSAQSPHLFQGFYIFLFGTSLAFLLYLHVAVLSSDNCLRRCPRLQCPEFRPWGRSQDQMGERPFTWDTSPEPHSGSFFLRLGALLFGMGAMVHSLLQFGEYVELLIDGCGASTAFGLRPFFNLVFTFVQLYFLFHFSKVCLQKQAVLVRVGLMHMLASNVCVWLLSVVSESVIAIQESAATTNDSLSSIPSQRLLSLQSCQPGLMRAVVGHSGPYLYPCSIEYSLICSGILYVMWRNVGKHVGQRTHEAAHQEAKAKAQRLSVDCSSSSRGLFCGIFVLVAVVISIITFFVLVNAGRTDEAAQLDNVSEILIYLLTSVVVVLAFLKMQPLHFEYQKPIDLEETLLLIGLTGIFIFSMFSIIAAALSVPDLLTSLIVTSSVLRMVQATLQTVFMLNAVRRRALDRGQERDKPGREFVTFLLVANIALWGISIFEVQQASASPIQVHFYGVLAWNIFTHVSSPLAIFFRFHSTVCLSNVWKHAWKGRALQASPSSPHTGDLRPSGDGVNESRF